MFCPTTLLAGGGCVNLKIQFSSDDEYRSSTNIVISLIKRYRNLIDRGGIDNLKEFIRAGVNAYALGCTDEGLRKELTNIKETGVEIEAMEKYGGSTSLKSIILSDEVRSKINITSLNCVFNIVLHKLQCREICADRLRVKSCVFKCRWMSVSFG